MVTVEHGFDLDPASLEPLIKNSLVSMEIFPFKLNDYSKFNLNPE